MAARNPVAKADDEWRFRTFEECAAVFGLSVPAFSAMAALPSFPMLTRKACPALVKVWMQANFATLQELKTTS